MQTQNIEGNVINFFTKEDLDHDDLGDERPLYEATYNLAEFMSHQLEIKCPDIGFLDGLRSHDDMGRISVDLGRMFTPKDVPSLKNNLILMSRENIDLILFTGTLAHEMRHIWQNKYHPKMNENPAKGFVEALKHPAEIDADGYAIWYISDEANMSIDEANMSIDEAAGIMCPEEKEHHPKEYMYRIEKAKELKAYFDEKRNKMVAGIEASKKQKSASILDKIKNIFR